MSRSRPTAAEHNTMGVYLNSRGAYDLAISELKKARRLAPQSATIHYNLAAAYFEKKALDHALSALKRALDLDPQYIKAHLLLGFVLEAKGSYEESQREFTWVVDHDPLGRSGREAKETLMALGAKIAARQRGIRNEHRGTDDHSEPQGSGETTE